MSENSSQKQPETPQKDAGKVFLQEVTSGAPAHPSGVRRALRSLTVPALAIFSGLVLGGLLIILTTEDFYLALRQSPVEGLKSAWEIIRVAYSSLFTGAIGDPSKIQAALQSGNAEEIRRAF